ncbi:MAG: COX15/CtaA family protein [Caldilineaceae bacterium]
MNTKRFGWFAWAVAAYNLVVILWGAFVRATGSGAGCGNHWPLCTGQLIPRSPQLETLIELSHRGSTGVLLFAVAGLVIGAFRLYPKGHPVRLGATLSAFFLFMEAALGAGLVLFEYVARNVSIARAWWDGTHLINTYFLVAVITLTAWWATGGKRLRLRNQGSVGWALLIALLGELILGATGAVIAMGDTLVLQAGISPESSPVLAQIIEMRIYHPILAFGVGALLIIAVWLVNWRRPSAEVKKFTRWLGAAFIAQLLIGAFNVALKAPVWVQLIHLLNADLIWMLFVLLSATALSQQEAIVTQPEMKRAELGLPAQ